MILCPVSLWGKERILPPCTRGGADGVGACGVPDKGSRGHGLSRCPQAL